MSKKQKHANHAEFNKPVTSLAFNQAKNILPHKIFNSIIGFKDFPSDYNPSTLEKLAILRIAYAKYPTKHKNLKTADRIAVEKGLV
jgi:hypothetical protein